MEKVNWWKKALVYQIYPLSFKDSNSDGIGDLNGITSKLDYLKTIGVDVIWLSPVYKSPMDDNGYDISDYYQINEIFGTMDDFKNLLKNTHQRGMKLIMDLVVNHTSDEHVWFKDAISNKNSKYRDYYIWSKKPNEIESVFSGSAWTYDDKSNEYYFHLFSKKQPDLNWNNKELRQEIYKMINYWLDLGIDGFRLDVIDLIGKDINQKRLADGPFLEDHLKEMYDTCFKGRDIMTVGETPGISIERAMELSNKPKNYLDMVFQFSHISLDEEAGKGKWFLKELDKRDLKNVFEKIQNIFKDNGWTSLFWSNHDQPRAVSRYGNDKLYRNKSAKMLHTLLYSLKGTSFVYQGEEIGMTSIYFDDIKDYRDVESVNMYNDFIGRGYSKDFIINSLKVKSRDNSRTPIQWNTTSYAGFSDKEPWIKVNSNYREINVENEFIDKDSILNYFINFFKIRKNSETLILGDTKFIDTLNNDVISYKREYKNNEIVVFANFSEVENDYIFEEFENYKLVITNYELFKINKINKLPPYYVGVYERNDKNGDN